MHSLQKYFAKQKLCKCKKGKKNFTAPKKILGQIISGTAKMVICVLFFGSLVFVVHC